MNLADGLSAQASSQPYGIAVIRGRRMLNFQELDELVWRSAAWLRRQGVAAGDIIGLSFRDEVRHLIASLALIRMGAVQIALPIADPAPLRNSLARRAGVALALSGREVESGLDYPTLLLAPETLPSVGDKVDLGLRVENADAPFIILVGSGTTGRSKLIPITPRQHLARRAAESEFLGLRSGDRSALVSSIDFYDSKRGRLDCALCGATNIFIGSDPAQIFLACRVLRVDHLRIVPRYAAELVAGLSSPDRPRLPALQSIRVGTATLSDRMRAAIRSRLAENLVVTYGSNETGPAALAPPAVQIAWPGAIGRPGRSVEVEVLGPDGRILPPGEIGEIRIRSPGMTTSYHNDPEATSAAFRDGWFHPNDLGAFTDDGVLIFHGRKDDMMILDGINIFPREIELALEEHPSVAEAVAFPVAHPVHQDVPAAVVVLREPASEQELIAFCRERIGRHAPHRVVAVAAIPDAARGKIMKRDLAQLFGFSRQPGSPNEPR